MLRGVGLGFEVESLGFGVQGLGCRVYLEEENELRRGAIGPPLGLGFRVLVQGFGA